MKKMTKEMNITCIDTKEVISSHSIDKILKGAEIAALESNESQEILASLKLTIRSSNTIIGIYIQAIR